MQLGEIYIWETEIQGRKKRKYHIFICPPSRDHHNQFLYINTMDWYKDYRLLQSDYKFLSYDSFVGCNAVATYTDAQLKTATPVKIGSMSKQHLKELRDAIITAETMPQIDANRVCAALAAVL
jgi:hypothetical protein